MKDLSAKLGFFVFGGENLMVKLYKVSEISVNKRSLKCYKKQV